MLIILLLALQSLAHTPAHIAQALPYRDTLVKIEPFLANKKAGISYSRIYMDGRPLIGVTPVLSMVETEFDSDFYSCLDKQTNTMISALEKTTTNSALIPKILLMSIKQYDGTLLETFCRPNISRTGDLTMTLMACYASRSSVNKESKCVTASVQEITEALSLLASEGPKREAAFNNLKKSSEKLLNLMSK